jgi:predicted RNase H-like HicB family nuclease
VAKRTKKYTATVERDEAGWWVATVHGIAGVHTQGRTLEQVRERVREALAAAKPGAVLGEVVIKPRDLGALLRKVQTARQRAKKQDAEAHKLLRLAARELEAKGVGRRDAGELLGVSFQRVQQLVDE